LVARLPVEVRLRAGCEDLGLPACATSGSAGVDLRAACEGDLTIPPGGRAAVPTGLFVAVPPGFELQVRPRSGLAFRQGLTVINAPGTIDSDYRGEIQILVVNLGDERVVVRRGDRVAQLVLAPVVAIDWQRVDELPASARGEGGFGSTGAR
jgi:dUTP pyrophosphatase